jgi:hypothetical protein
MVVCASLRAMTADGLRDMLWLHAEPSDRQKQRQQAKDRHEEVQPFFHANEFDAVPNGFDTDRNELICYFNSILLRREVGRREEIVTGIVYLLTGANKIIAVGREEISQRRRS